MNSVGSLPKGKHCQSHESVAGPCLKYCFPQSESRSREPERHISTFRILKGTTGDCGSESPRRISRVFVPEVDLQWPTDPQDSNSLVCLDKCEAELNSSEMCRSDFQNPTRSHELSVKNTKIFFRFKGCTVTRNVEHLKERTRFGKMEMCRLGSRLFSRESYPAEV